jgi:hypothetical protein
MTKKISLNISPVLIDDSNLSRAWARAALYVIDHPGLEISPLIISVTGFDENGLPEEDVEVRSELDKILLSKKMRSISDVAFTIFPQRIWKIAKGDRAKLFEYYRSTFPRYQAMNPKGNSRGLYFERLMSYGRGPCEGNQLEWILSQHNARKGVRRSMYPASIFDPDRDHIATAQLQFPCLQHITFEPASDGLVINAFYATQQLFVKAYGNYLGLAQLGAFMAQEMNLKLTRMNVVIGVAKFQRISKTHAQLIPLVAAARACVARKESVAEVALAHQNEGV